MNATYRLRSASLFLSTLLSSAAMAAPPPSIPDTPSWEPGQIQQRLRIPDKLPGVGGPPIVHVPKEMSEQELSSKVKFTLKALTVQGATVFTQEELRSEYQQYIGKEVSLATISTIANDITVRYRNAGYILSRALIPEQQIANGDVKIQVVEGFVSKVVFSGFDKGTPALLTAYGKNISDDRPLNARTLERYLLIMQDLPGVKASATLRPSEDTPGAAELFVSTEQKYVDATATLDNRGSRYVGPIEGGLTLGANNALGIYDHTQLHVVNTAENNELHYTQLLHEEQVDSEGTKLAFSFAHTNSNPAFKLAPFEVESQDNDYMATLSHPFIRSRLANLYGNLSLEARETNVDTLGSLLYQDRLRVVRAGGSYDMVDDFSAVNRLTTVLSKGLGWDDNSSVKGNGSGGRSREGGRTDFSKMEGQVSRLQPLYGSYSLYAAATGQLAADKLLASEQFSVGGPNFGSMYDPSELTGDSGYALRTELLYTRDGDFDWLPSYQLYSFWDFGQVWTRGVAAGQKASPSLASTGIGLRFTVMQPLSGSMELGFPLTKLVAANGADGNRPRAFFSLAYHY